MKQIYFPLALTLFAISTHAQNWSGNTPGNIYYNSGNVGIGTDNPVEDLDVNGIAQSKYFFANAPNTAYTGLQIKDDNGLQWAVIKQNKANPDFRIVRYKNGTYLGDVLYAEHDNGNLHIIGGDVGIGTITPEAKLDVNGYARSKYFIAKAENTAYTGLTIKDDNGLQWGVIKQNKANPDFRIVRYKNGTYLGDVLYAEHDNGNLHIVGGDVGIGTTSTDAKLTVKGDIHAEEVRVDLNVPAPDYVFAEDYDLPSLESISAFIKDNQHLPEIPPAKEMEKEGIDLGVMSMLLLKKIEELTLYVIEQSQRIQSQDVEIKSQNQIIATLHRDTEALKKMIINSGLMNKK